MENTIYANDSGEFVAVRQDSTLSIKIVGYEKVDLPQEEVAIIQREVREGKRDKLSFDAKLKKLIDKPEHKPIVDNPKAKYNDNQKERIDLSPPASTSKPSSN